LNDLKTDVTLFSETHLKSHTRFCVPDYDIYRTDPEDGHKDRTAVVVKKGVPHACVDLPPLLSADATGVCIPIGNTKMFLAVLYKSPQRLRSGTDIIELLDF
jgi:hypothetical protein